MVMSTILENQNKIKAIRDRKKPEQITETKEIERINNITNRVETGFFTSRDEFVYSDGSNVKENTPFHIHYTTDLEEYFMTQTSHSGLTSKLIYRVNNFSDFTIYNSLNKQNPLQLKSSVVRPTDNQYITGFYPRYFAKKSNENSKPFEISERDYETSPLYDYVTIDWAISGDKDFVKRHNDDEKIIAEATIKSISKLLPDYQYYRVSGLTKKEEVEARLGLLLNIQQEVSADSDSSNQSSVAPTTDAQVDVQPGPPPGVTSGGAGGYGGY